MSIELRKAREQADAMHQLLAEVQRAVHDSDGHIVELRHGADCLHRHLLTTKGLIVRKVHDKGRVQHAAAAHTQEHLNAIIEENASLRLGHAELLSRLNATAQELEQQKKLGAEAAGALLQYFEFDWQRFLNATDNQSFVASQNCMSQSCWRRKGPLCRRKPCTRCCASKFC